MTTALWNNFILPRLRKTARKFWWRLICSLSEIVRKSRLQYILENIVSLSMQQTHSCRYCWIAPTYLFRTVAPNSDYIWPDLSKFCIYYVSEQLYKNEAQFCSKLKNKLRTAMNKKTKVMLMNYLQSKLQTFLTFIRALLNYSGIRLINPRLMNPAAYYIQFAWNRIVLCILENVVY